MGIHKDEEKGNSYYLLEETYYDAEEKGVTQSDSERVDDIVRLQNKYNPEKIKVIYLPHDAASLKSACQKDPRVKAKIETYVPNTYEDITNIQNLIATRRFKIHTSCRHSLSQVQTYCWDKKAQRRGEDKPLKVNDHCPDMWRGGIFGPRMIKSTPQLGVVYL